MINLGHRTFNDRPHPNPLSQGEGITAMRFDYFGGQLGKLSRWFLRKPMNVSPSPGGEGRGEGGRSN